LRLDEQFDSVPLCRVNLASGGNDDPDAEEALLKTDIRPRLRAGSVRRDLREILTHFDEFRAAVRSKRISKAFAERIMLAVSAVNGCRYCSYGHVRSALKYGVSSEEVDLLLRGEVGHVASDEVPALLFAQHYA